VGAFAASPDALGYAVRPTDEEQRALASQPATAAAPARESVSAPISRGRRILVWVLVVVATLLLLLCSLTVWVKRQALDSNAWADKSEELLADPTIRAGVAAYMVDQLYSNVDVKARLEQRLPDQADALAAPLAGLLREVALRSANEFLSRPAVLALWRGANYQAHRAFLALIDDDTIPGITRADGSVVLNLRPLIDRLAVRVGVEDRVNEKLPPDAGQIRLMSSKQLDTAETMVRILKALTIFLLIAVFVLYALALYLARGRRRETLRGIGIGILLIGILLLVIRRLAGDWVIGTLTSNPSGEKVGDHVWVIGTSLLKDIGWLGVALGLIALVGAWLAGPSRWATEARRHLAGPFREHPVIVYLVAAIVFLIFLIYGPASGDRQIIFVVGVAVALAVGIEALRRQTLREFPAAAPSAAPVPAPPKPQ
jgi:hypothetical protein